MAAEQWERRQGWRARGGWTWSTWQPCTETEAMRVTGLRSWEVRQTGQCAACDGSGRVPYGVKVTPSSINEAWNKVRAEARVLAGMGKGFSALLAAVEDYGTACAKDAAHGAPAEGGSEHD